MYISVKHDSYQKRYVEEVVDENEKRSQRLLKNVDMNAGRFKKKLKFIDILIHILALSV